MLKKMGMKRILMLLFATVLLCSCGENAPYVSNEVDGSKAEVNNEDYSDDKEKNVTSISETFYDRIISLAIPESWNALRISDDIFDLQHIGIQLFEGEIPQKREMYDGKLFIAIAASGNAANYIDDYSALGTEFIEDTYTSKSGYKMTLYYIDGLPDYATFDDYPEMCIFFDLNNSDDVDVIFEIVDSIEFGESDDAEAPETEPPETEPEET